MRIQTDRLILRPLTVDDLDQVLELNGEPAVIEFLGSSTPERARRRLEVCQQSWEERGHDLMALLERSTGRFVGRMGLRYWPQFGEAEAGWSLRREAWGRGYATEAARAVIDWGFRTFPLPYITAMIRPDNGRSLAVARRLGMTPVRDDVLHQVPVIVHAVYREMWGAGPPSDEVERLLAHVADWAQRQEDLAAVAVGPVTDSGAQLVFVSADPLGFPDAEQWAAELAGATVVASARRGTLLEHQLQTSSRLELRITIESAPSAGLRPLYDPDGVLG
jgi:RimJ/RimL family protein N-acetyltransferase